MGILNTLNTVFVLACVNGLVGCGSIQPPELPVADATPAYTTAPGDTSAPSITEAPTPVPTATPTPSVSVTYYSLSKTVTPNSSAPSKKYTATGYCAVYTGKTYCWDDGVKSLDIFGSTFTYTYWNMSKNVVGYSLASGGLKQDAMPVPTLIQPLSGLANNLPAGSVNTVLTTGTPNTVDCTDDGDGNIDCGTFVIDTLQVTLF